MPDYQTAEGMAVESYIEKLSKLREALQTILTLSKKDINSDDELLIQRERIKKIKRIAKKVLQ